MKETITTGPKQTIYDYLDERKDEFMHSGCTVIMDTLREELTIKYPPSMENPVGKTVALNRDNFPNGDLIPVYDKNNKGKSVLIGYIQGKAPEPGPSMKAFLESGEKHYIPQRSTEKPHSYITDRIHSFAASGVEM